MIAARVFSSPYSVQRLLKLAKKDSGLGVVAIGVPYDKPITFLPDGEYELSIGGADTDWLRICVWVLDMDVVLELMVGGGVGVTETDELVGLVDLVTVAANAP